MLLLSSLLPAVKSGSLLNQAPAGQSVKFDRKLLTGGCDNHLRLWRLNEENNSWYEVRAFSESGESAHSDWVRDAQFAPSLGLPSNTIASCSEDKTVLIWTEDPSTGAWRKAKQLVFDTKVYKVSWSLMGNILAVAQGDNKISLWKESIEGDWKSLSQAQAQQSQQPPQQGYAAPPSPAQQQGTMQPAGHAQDQHPPQQQQQQQQYQPQQQGFPPQQQQGFAAQPPMAQYGQQQQHPPQQPAYGGQPAYPQQAQYGGATAF